MSPVYRYVYNDQSEKKRRFFQSVTLCVVFMSWKDGPLLPQWRAAMFVTKCRFFFVRATRQWFFSDSLWTQTPGEPQKVLIRSFGREGWTFAASSYQSSQPFGSVDSKKKNILYFGSFFFCFIGLVVIFIIFVCRRRRRTVCDWLDMAIQSGMPQHHFISFSCIPSSAVSMIRSPYFYKMKELLHRQTGGRGRLRPH